MADLAGQNAAPAPWHRSTSLLSPAFLAGFVLVSLLLLALSFYSIDHNDFMYAPSAVQDGALYEEVHYLQTPVGYWILKSLAATIGSGFKYFGLRLYSVLFVLAAVLIGCRTFLETTGQRLIFVGFVGTSPYVLSLGQEIGTYSLSLLIVAASFAVIYKRFDRPLFLILSGALVGLSLGAKLNHLLFCIPPAIYILLHTKADFRLLVIRQSLLGFGFILGAIPTLYHALAAPEPFLLHNLIFHTEFAAAANGFADSAVMLQRITSELLEFARIHILFLLIAVFVLAHTREKRAEFYFLLFAVLTAFIVAVSPRILYDQYLGPAAYFIGILFAKCVWLPGARLTRAILVVSVPLLGLLIGLESLSSIAKRHKQGDRNLIAVSETMSSLNAAFQSLDTARRGCAKTLFTYAGAFVIDTGFELSRYTEAGIAWRRQAPFVDARYVANPAYGLESDLLYPLAYIEREGVAFMMVGWYPDEEAELVAYAEANGFGRKSLGTIDGKHLKLLYKPECLAD